MAEAHEAPQGGGLSIDEAVALLDRREDSDGGDSPLAGAGDEDFEGDASPPEDDGVRAEPPDDEDDEAEVGEEGDADRLSAPKYWSKDAKARFAELDPELQAVVLSQEGPREEAAAKAKAEAEDLKTSAVTHAAEAYEIARALSEALPDAYQHLQARWAGVPDWASIAETHGVEAANQLRSQFAAEQAQLAQAHAAAQALEDAEQLAYVAREVVTLKALDPELVDPVKGDALRGEIVSYLTENGLPSSALTGISAIEISLARKAMLWDRAQQRARTSATSHRPAPQATRPLARGGASIGTADPKARRAAQAKTRFAKTRSLEDAVALLNAQGD